MVSLLRGLATAVLDGRATANLRIELQPSGEVWLVAARLPRANGSVQR